jgi:glutamate formiminotransferase
VPAIIEAVPNVSEGCRLDVVDRLAHAVDRADGAHLLDRTSDADHGRSVLTVAGRHRGVVTSMEGLVEVALEAIDMRLHRGVHPRIGAVDVVPFVPLAGSSSHECVELARSFAATVGERHHLPVYLYADAAVRPERRSLAHLRRAGFEGLAEWMGTPDGVPDAGPHRPHPTAGAMAVGARPVLIAWNIQLETEDVAVARRIAGRIRERGGGLRGVQALGFPLAEQRSAQVSINVLDHAATPLWRLWERVGELAAGERVSVRDSELIGLMPRAALEAVADHIGARGQRTAARLAEAAAWLRLRDYAPDRVLEARLALVSGTG